MNKVGQSVFYDCIDLSPTAEKQDDMKPERSDTEEESEFQFVPLVYTKYAELTIRFSVRYRPGLHNIFGYNISGCGNH